MEKRAKKIIKKKLLNTARYYSKYEDQLEDIGWQRIVDQEFGYMMGVEVALNTEGEEFNQISEMWEDFRAAAYPCYVSTFEDFIKKYEEAE